MEEERKALTLHERTMPSDERNEGTLCIWLRHSNRGAI